MSSYALTDRDGMVVRTSKGEAVRVMTPETAERLNVALSNSVPDNGRRWVRRPSFTDVCIEHGPGGPIRSSRTVRVF